MRQSEVVATVGFLVDDRKNVCGKVSSLSVGVLPSSRFSPFVRCVDASEQRQDMYGKMNKVAV